MNILVTGSNGFIGKNLIAHLRKLQGINIFEFNRGDSDEYLLNHINNSDFIVHLAGVNRPEDIDEFEISNSVLTSKICNFVAHSNKKIPILFTSSTHVQSSSNYGKSKLAAENILVNLHKSISNPVRIMRLPGIFGKYCKPNYNSVVATFSHNIANNIPIKIIEPNKSISLVYIDDLINKIISLFTHPLKGIEYLSIEPEYHIQIGDLAKMLYQFKESNHTLEIGNVGSGLAKALFATFLSYLPQDLFSYPLLPHNDKRGSFVEVLKSQNYGQISYFVAKPGITRGGHYHHTKCEKFIIAQGTAKFCFLNILTNARHEIIASGNAPCVIQTIPGWAHDITNIGTDDLIAIIWTNEIFDQSRPDTIRFDL
jgi:UDP-2-acetamido-2,6-beta-L-arabino-hexul-4-ose reductase